MELFKFDSQFSFQEKLAPGATLLRAFCLPQSEVLLGDLKGVVECSPWRHMLTPGGHEMSVAMSNCGSYGWITDSSGYRYQGIDPITKLVWPKMPASFYELASSAARTAGYDSFAPDACLINRYKVDSRLTLHQDKNEKDFSQPIVSVSLGIPATFLFGGHERSAKILKIHLEHGDVVVWGGESRLNYHGILPLKSSHHPLTDVYRYNLTFRKAR